MGCQLGGDAPGRAQVDEQAATDAPLVGFVGEVAVVQHHVGAHAVLVEAVVHLAADGALGDVRQHAAGGAVLGIDQVEVGLPAQSLNQLAGGVFLAEGEGDAGDGGAADVGDGAVGGSGAVADGGEAVTHAAAVDDGLGVGGLVGLPVGTGVDGLVALLFQAGIFRAGVVVGQVGHAVAGVEVAHDAQVVGQPVAIAHLVAEGLLVAVAVVQTQGHVELVRAVFAHGVAGKRMGGAGGRGQAGGVVAFFQPFGADAGQDFRGDLLGGTQAVFTQAGLVPGGDVVGVVPGVADAALAELGVQSGVRAELVVGAQAGQFQALLGGQGGVAAIGAVEVGVDGVAHGHDGDVRGGGEAGVEATGDVVALPAVLVVLVAGVVTGGGVEAVAALAAHVEGAGDLFIAARDAAAHLHVAAAADAGFAADAGLGTGTVGQVLHHAAAGILAVDARGGATQDFGAAAIGHGQQREVGAAGRADAEAVDQDEGVLQGIAADGQTAEGAGGALRAGLDAAQGLEGRELAGVALGVVGGQHDDIAGQRVDGGGHVGSRDHLGAVARGGGFCCGPGCRCGLRGGTLQVVVTSLVVLLAGVSGASGTGVVLGSLRHGGRDGCQGEGCGNGRGTGASLEHGFLRKVQPAGCTSPGRNSVVSPAV